MTVDFLNRQAWAGAPNAPGLPGLPLGGGTYVPADIASAWWDLEPGSNVIAFTADSYEAGASCLVAYYDSFM
jgi:hypothetical protein